MNWEALSKRFRSLGQGSTALFALPNVVMEVQPGFVAGAKLDTSLRQVQRLGVRELEDGSLQPLPNRTNVTNEAAIRRAIAEVAEIVGHGGGRLGLILPDATVRVGIFDFETLPDNRKEAEELVRWRMRDHLPFPTEEARVSYQVFGRATNSVELLAVAVRASVLAEYENALEGVNGGPILTLPASIAMLPLLAADATVGQLLVHVCCGSVTTVVVAGGRVRLWRNRSASGQAEEELRAEIHREVSRALAASRDHLKVDIGPVWLCARPLATQELANDLTQTIGQKVDPLPGAAGRIVTLPASDQELFERYGTPVAGLLANQA
jgi:hypothetical protein